MGGRREGGGALRRGRGRPHGGAPPEPLVGGLGHKRRSQGASPVWRGGGGVWGGVPRQRSPPGASLGQPLGAPPLQAPLLQLRPQYGVLTLQFLHLGSMGGGGGVRGGASWGGWGLNQSPPPSPHPHPAAQSISMEGAWLGPRGRGQFVAWLGMGRGFPEDTPPCTTPANQKVSLLWAESELGWGRGLAQGRSPLPCKEKWVGLK